MSDTGFIDPELRIMPEEWRLTTLENLNLFSYFSGLWTGKKPPFVPAKVIRNTNFNNDGSINYGDVALLQVENRHLRERELKRGDIIIERSGGGPTQPVGRVVYFDRTERGYSFSNFTSTLRVVNPKVVHSKFLLYYLLLFYFEGNTLTLQQKTTGIRNLNFSDYKKSSIPLPPLPEQEKIAAILSKIQQAIEVQEKIIERTKELKKAMMAKLFTEGLHGEELKETEIGLMPKSWEVVSIRDVAKFQGGYAFKSVDYSKSGVRLFKISNVSFGKCVWDDVSFLPKEYLNQQAEFALACGDLVMAMTRPIVSGGIKVARLSELDCPALLNQRVGRFLIKGNVDIGFLFQLVFDARFIAAISDGAGGSQQPNISSKQIERIRIPLPTIDEQLVIGKILSQIDLKIKITENQNATLRQLFKSMLHQLMIGRIRVSHIEIPFDA